MNELVKKYRAAPRQVSPSRLDNSILNQARQKIPAKRHSPMVMSPWKTMAASFCVVGLGVALLLRYGVPPLNQMPGATSESDEVAGLPEPNAELSMADTQQNKPLVAERNSRSLVRQEFEDKDLVDDGGSLIEQSESAMAEKREDATPALSSADDVAAETETSVILMSQAPLVQAIEIAPGVELAAEPESLPLEQASLAENTDVQAEEGVAVVLTDEMFAEEIVTGVDANTKQSLSVVGESSAENSSGVSITRSASPSLPKSLAADSSVLANKRLSKQGSANGPMKEIAPQADRLPTVIQEEIVVVDALQWLASQRATHFTLQLATATDAGYLDEFARSLNLTKDWYVIELGGNQAGHSVNNFGLLYGVFETSDEALIHIDTLDEKSSQFGPWVRSFKRLRDEVSKP